MDKKLSEQSLQYHNVPFPGKISMVPTKGCETQLDLSLAYSPGVAAPCLEIAEDPEMIWKYTSKGNIVAVVSDGSAVLGLGNIGGPAGLPVMEGKAILFKRFAGIDALPVCLKGVANESGRTDAKKVIEITDALEPNYGGINLEDIGAPACFEIEDELKKRMSIPVFHDDQHGTAIISLAGVLNAAQIAGKNLGELKVVVNGAGAAGIACTEFYIAAGVRRENVIICDSKGVIYKGRAEGMTPQKEMLANDTSARSLAEALEGADVFLGLSVADCVTKEMVASMADHAIIFAMANPVPEIYPPLALEAGALVVGTGRSDFPNQVNNVLGFPGIFRGALDVRASDINEEMKVAAAEAIAELAKEPIDAELKAFLSHAYPEDAAKGVFDGDNPLKAEYVIPKPFDPRVVPRVARRVAEAAIKTGVAAIVIDDMDAYEAEVKERVAAVNA